MLICTGNTAWAAAGGRVARAQLLLLRNLMHLLQGALEAMFRPWHLCDIGATDVHWCSKMWCVSYTCAKASICYI
jgi:hypothetical protein